MSQQQTAALGLDIGTVRIGIAKAIWPNGLAIPYKTLVNNESFTNELLAIIDNENVSLLIAGLPRGLNGQETQQSHYVINMVEQLRQATGMEIVLQDEAVTSIKAEEELRSRKKPFNKGDVDALSATYILEDYINEHLKGAGVVD